MTDSLFDIDTTPTPKAHACTGMTCQVCHTEADTKRDAKIRQAADHADEDWKAQAALIVRQFARLGIDFTTDEVMERLDASTFTTHEPRALGGVIRNALRDGLIVQVGYTKSRRRHSSPIPVYCGGKR